MNSSVDLVKYIYINNSVVRYVYRKRKIVPLLVIIAHSYRVLPYIIKTNHVLFFFIIVLSAHGVFIWDQALLNHLITCTSRILYNEMLFNCYKLPEKKYSRYISASNLKQIEHSLQFVIIIKGIAISCEQLVTHLKCISLRFRTHFFPMLFSFIDEVTGLL